MSRSRGYAEINMTPRKLLFTLFAAVSFFLLWQSNTALSGVKWLQQAVHPLTRYLSAPCPECNILVVNLDTLRAPEMPCYGYFRNTTPNLCAYAEENLRFANFYTQTPFTLDSHMSIFTGLYPMSHHVIEALRDRLNPDIPIMAEVLKKNGYHTVWAGPTNDINLPLDRGFGRGFDEFHYLNGNSPDWSAGYGKLLPKFLDSKPTFMFLHTYGVHTPYTPGHGPYQFITPDYPQIPVTEEEFRSETREYYEFVLSKFTDRLKASVTPESIQYNSDVVDKLTQALRGNDLMKARDTLWELPDYENYSLYMAWYHKLINVHDPAMLAYFKGLYDERIYQIDQQLIPLFNFLNRPEVKKKTIVIFLSDNGEDFMEHGYLDHGWHIYNTATHTPFILAVPGMGKEVYHELVQAVDIFPTLLDLIGIKHNIPFDGISLFSVIQGKGLQHIGDRYLIGQFSGGDIISIRNSRWKMYKNSRPRQYVELYDLMKDPLEQNNVLGDYLDIARHLDAALTATMDNSPKYASVSGEFPDWLDDEKRRRLMFEGYF